MTDAAKPNLHSKRLCGHTLDCRLPDCNEDECPLKSLERDQRAPGLNIKILEGKALQLTEHSLVVFECDPAVSVHVARDVHQQLQHFWKTEGLPGAVMLIHGNMRFVSVAEQEPKTD